MAPRALRHRVGEGHEQRALAGVGLRVGALDAPRDQGQLPLRLHQPHAVLQPGDGVEPVDGAQALLLRGERERHPQLGAYADGEAEPGRQDADHGVGNPVENERAADDVRVGAQAAPPELLRENGHPVVPRAVFRREEVSPDHGLDPQHAEEVRGDALRLHVRRAVPRAVQGEVVLLEGAQLFEDVIGGSPVLEIAAGHVGARLGMPSERAPQVDEAVGLGIGKWLQDPCVHEAEDRGVRADAEGEGQQGDGAEGRVPAQQARPESQVPPQDIQPRHTAAVAVALLRRLDAAEPGEGLPASVFGREAGAPAIVGVHLQVALDLLGQLPLPPLLLEEIGQSQHEDAQPPHRGSSPGVRKRATMRLASSHCRASFSTCFRPAFVSR